MSSFVVSSVVLQILIQCAQDSASSPYLNSSVDKQTEPRTAISRIRRIVGGVDCEVHGYPFVVALISADASEAHYCGGSLIHWKSVLTAAHCFPKGDNFYNDHLVRAGGSVVRAHETKMIRNFKSIHRHPDFDVNTLKNDIAVVKLKNGFYETSHVKLAKLPRRPTKSIDEESVPECAAVMALGWGETEAGADIIRTKPGKQLKCAQLPTVPNKECTKIADWIKDQVICTMYKTGGIDTCKGDTGGPLVCTIDHEILIGIISGGKGCAQIDTPSFATRVDHYLDFIEPYRTSATSLRIRTARSSYICHVIYIISVIILRECISAL